MTWLLWYCVDARSQSQSISVRNSSCLSRPSVRTMNTWNEVDIWLDYCNSAVTYLGYLESACLDRVFLVRWILNTIQFASLYAISCRCSIGTDTRAISNVSGSSVTWPFDAIRFIAAADLISVGVVAAHHPPILLNAIRPTRQIINGWRHSAFETVGCMTSGL